MPSCQEILQTYVLLDVIFCPIRLRLRSVCWAVSLFLFQNSHAVIEDRILSYDRVETLFSFVFQHDNLL